VIYQLLVAPDYWVQLAGPATKILLYGLLSVSSPHKGGNVPTPHNRSTIVPHLHLSRQLARSQLWHSEVAMDQSGKYDGPRVSIVGEGEGEARNVAPDADGVKDQQEPQIVAVEYAWDDFTEDQCLSAKDHRQMQSGSVRERHALTLDGVDNQIK